jgi:hypothetical protein
VVLAGLAGLLSWPILGGRGALLLLAALLLALLFHHLRNLSTLYRWLQNPRLESVPVGSGAWEYVFSPLLRMLKRQKQSEAGLSAALDRFQLAGAARPTRSSGATRAPRSISASTSSATAASRSPTCCASRSSSTTSKRAPAASRWSCA